MEGQKRIGDIYEDTILPYPDAHVASALCIGGPIKYDLRDGSGLDDGWIKVHVIPNIALRYDDAVCSVLGRALLWSCFDAEASAYVPRSIKDHVVNEYLNLPQQLPEGENPIKKVLLVINGAEDQVIITELGDMNEATGNGVGASGQVSRNDYLALLNEVRHLRSENRQLHEMTTGSQGWKKKLLLIMASCKVSLIELHGGLVNLAIKSLPICIMVQHQLCPLVQLCVMKQPK